MSTVKSLRCPFCGEALTRLPGQAKVRCLKCGATERFRKMTSEGALELVRTMLPFGIRARMIFDWRNLYLGASWDLRATGLNFWICVIPFYTIQIVIPYE